MKEDRIERIIKWLISQGEIEFYDAYRCIFGQ